MKLWKKIQSFMDVSGGSIMGLWSMTMIALTIYSVLQTKTIDGGAVTLYLGAIGAFAVHKTGTRIAEIKNDTQTDTDK